MRIRYLSFVSLGAAGVFLVIASQAFALADIANLALGVGIGVLVVSLATAWRYRRHIPSLVCASLTAVIGAWMILASQVFSLGAVQNLTFAESLAIVGLSLAGLTAHELSTERVVHSLGLVAVGVRGEEGDRERERYGSESLIAS